MIDETIIFNGNEYTKRKIIKSLTKTYVEYRNTTLKRIKFFELENGALYSITDKDDLKQAINANYITNESGY